MDTYLHRVLGFYAGRAPAEAGFRQLVRLGIPVEKVKILEPGEGGGSAESKADNHDVLKELLREGATLGAGIVILRVLSVL